MQRRDFIKLGAAAAGSTILGATPVSAASKPNFVFFLQTFPVTAVNFMKRQI